jgi:hypothetical protein
MIRPGFSRERSSEYARISLQYGYETEEIFGELNGAFGVNMF